MLDAIGVASVDELLSEIPEAVRLSRPLDLPAGLSEQEVYEHLAALAARSRHADEEITFIGAGMYDHYVPAIVDSIILRSEFLTPYTPYQPEVSQGTLQVMFEFQTAISELTGLPVSNASVYEGPSAVAAAGYMAKLENRRGKIVVSADPLTLGILMPPGDFGADICVGEGQSLGNRLDFGGPSFGFFAAAERYIRRMPGRIAGETVDADGKRGFVLTLQTREQHIRREKATHNICTAQALNALAGTVYLSWLGKQGVVELGELMIRRTAYAREALGLERINPGPVVREFAVRVPNLEAFVDRARGEGINPG